ncbi:cyclic pyranopterin monophosphate synthase MoaC [Veillonella agrestimuris]|uniref:cyclic pyranopterin monophosphate synthase MoaC n=1 Tax=Veillonella agrestimuris TaxID=2941340 RepID=UPI00240820EB|nr:cyclic pyranopterin monophosphate synthase MoaC [Veillonella agrestimuris]
MDLTHFDDKGNAWMVDVSQKEYTDRIAIAEGFISINDRIYERIVEGTMKKGDVLSVAQLAAIMGAKQTSHLIPLCHPLMLTKVEVQCSLVEVETSKAVKIRATVKTTGQTGVEMEALTAVQIGLLTVYDMCKAIDKSMVIGPTYLVEKDGGKSGHFVRPLE